MNISDLKGLARRACATLAVGLLALAAHAQPYPNKQIRLVVPYPAGGATDTFARTVFSRMGELLGQPIVIDSKPGASSIIGADIVAKAPPDGYTLLIGDMGTYALNVSLYKNLRYDPQKNFAPISLTARVGLILVVNPDHSPYKTMGEFLGYARANPGRINYAAPGPGSPLHLAMEIYKQQANISATGIPYKGGADALKDLLAGQIHVMFLDTSTAIAQIKAGKLRALAVASDKRMANLPDVPTVAEAGVPGYEAWAWQGFVAPAGTPPEIIAKLNATFATAMQDPAIKQRLIEAGWDPLTGTPEQFSSYMAAEIQKWGGVIKASNISLE